MANGMRQLAGTKTRYRRAHAAPLAGLISDRLPYDDFQETMTRPCHSHYSTSRLKVLANSGYHLRLRHAVRSLDDNTASGGMF